MDNGTYKLSESDKSYYLKIFSELLEEKSITMLLNNANINTMRQVAQHVYQTDLNYVDNIHCNIPENYQNTYKNIVQILKE